MTEQEQIDISKLFYINCSKCGKPLGIYEGEDFDIVFNKRTIIKARIMCKKCSEL